ncbi:MAG: hypothetical protein U0359_37590 [Byssovorax sp.]
MPTRALRTAIVAISLCLGLAGCSKEPTRWDAAASAKPAAIASDAPPVKAGGSFNAFFPADGVEGTKRVFSQEKAGFVEAKLSKDGKPLATLTISDTTTEPDAKKKFENASDKVKGYPLVLVGKNQSALLVKDRYQVKVSSPDLDPDARKAWLERFDLAGLAGL